MDVALLKLRDVSLSLKQGSEILFVDWDVVRYPKEGRRGWCLGPAKCGG